MLQRPGCFVWYVIAAMVGLAMLVNWVNDTRANAVRASAAPFADGQQNVAAVIAPAASATIAFTATPNPLVLTEASSNATHGAAITALANDQATHDTGTRIASTQTPASWTAVAVGIRETADAAAADKAKAEAALAWGTVTAAVATETERPRKEQTAAAIAEENRIATAIAIATADEARRQAEARAKYYGDMAAEGWGKLQVAIPYLLLAFFAIMALMGAGAVLNRIEAPTWPFRAKAKVIVDAGPAPAPKVDAPESIARTVNRRRRDLVRDDQRARLIGFVEAAIRIAGSGDGNVVPSQSDFKAAGFDSVDWWDTSVGDLVDLGLARTSRGNGGGTFAAGDLNLNSVADILRRGSEA